MTTLTETELSAKAPAAATRPEIELLLCCARTSMDTTTAEQFRILLQEDIDWDYLFQMARRHKMRPLLYWHLNSICSEVVPQTILEQLQKYFNDKRERNEFLTKELLKLLNLFETHEISAIPYKGPILAASVYGNLTLRDFWDLDIIVHEQDYPRAEELLISQGYYPPPEQNIEWERCFVNDNSSVEVDLHRKLTPWDLPFPIDFEGWWERREPVSLINTTVLSFSPEDLLIILCVQVAKDSQWRAELLIKICDIAELIHAHPVLDWKRVWQQSVKLGSKRILLFSLYLASELLGTVLPEEILLKMQADHIAKLASVQVCEELFNSSEKSSGERIFLRKLGRERWRDKIRYFLRIAITPNEKDWALLPLPNSLFFLYYLLRPLRLIGKYGRLSLKRLGTRQFRHAQ